MKPQDIFEHYTKNCMLTKDITKLKDIMLEFCNYLKSCPECNEINKNNIRQFLIDMPIEVVFIYVDYFDKFNRKSKEFLYIADLHLEFYKYEDYKEGFYIPLLKYAKID